ncbi:hypothetical protein DVH24_004179 [Malus domestica]|uniref:Beta-glucosidase n=1 Tax=Malus domestica TaxID=3750 RepID=A0A498K8C8_MALDO|nr:hypothetical protein DVH24_004179 [Malus domestica]
MQYSRKRQLNYLDRYQNSQVMAMKYSRSLLFGVLLLIGFALTNSKAANTDPPVYCEFLNRNSFEPGFIFGTGSASYQYEGAVKEDGRGPSIWDTYTHKHPEKIADGSNGDVAIDQYHRYKEDVGIMKDMELDAYRFSISWSRYYQVNGTLSGGVNRKGIDYYDNLTMNSYAMPFVTLFHGDVPQALEDEYAIILKTMRNFVIRNLVIESSTGSRKMSHILLVTWVMLTGRCSSWQNLNCTGGDSAIEPYLVAHHLLLAHGAAVELYKNRYQATQKGLIGITLVSDWFEPASDSKQDKDAALRSLDFMFGWQVLDPLTSGDYPHTMRSIYASSAPNNNSLPASYVTDSRADLTSECKGNLLSLMEHSLVPQAASDWLHVYPKGIHDLVLYTKEKYNDPLIYITENGVSELNNPELSLEEALHDTSRIDYYYRHLCYLQAAIKNGAKVKGYFAWTLLDDFEWTAGYTVRFGLNYVDYKDGLKRYPKLSAHWFKNFLKKNKFKESYSSL